MRPLPKVFELAHFKIDRSNTSNQWVEVEGWLALLLSSFLLHLLALAIELTNYIDIAQIEVSNTECVNAYATHV